MTFTPNEAQRIRTHFGLPDSPEIPDPAKVAEAIRKARHEFGLEGLEESRLTSKPCALLPNS